MALLTARVFYKSRNEYVYWGRDEVKIHYERRGTYYRIQTYPGEGKPPPGVAGLRLDLDEETMQSLLTALNDMVAKGIQPT